MNTIQKVLLGVSLSIVALATLCGMWMVWAEDQEYAGKAFWSLAILLAGCLVASAIEGGMRAWNKQVEKNK